MFGRGRKRSRDQAPRGGIDTLPVEEFDDSGGTEASQEPEAPPEAAQAREGYRLDDPVYGQSRESRREAERRQRMDDQQKQTVFACACVVAGFCGIAGIVFGTAAVCGSMSRPQQAVAAPPGLVTGQGQDVYYDASGRMHVNVHITREPDREVNIYIDQDGNVTTDKPEDGDADPGTGDAQAPADGTGEDANGGQKEDGTGGDAMDPGTTDADTDTDTGGDGENPPTGAGTEPDEAALLEEQEQRRQKGGSGYAETDVVYTVVRGDTLSAISGRTGYSVDFLAAYNSIKDKNLIITGESLRYPRFE